MSGYGYVPNTSFILQFFVLNDLKKAMSTNQESDIVKSCDEKVHINKVSRAITYTENAVKEDNNAKGIGKHKSDDAEERRENSWSWVVLFAASATYLLVCGGQSGFGVLYVEVLPHFGQSKALTAWIYSIQNGVQIFGKYSNRHESLPTILSTDRCILHLEAVDKEHGFYRL